MLRDRLWRDGPRIPSILLFGLVAAALLGGVFAIFQNLAVERDEREQVQRTTEIMTALRDASRALINAETGQRGYLFTGDPDYLAPYSLGVSKWPEAMDRLDRQLAPIANREQAQLLRQVRDLGNLKLDELEDTIELVESGEIERARERVMTDEGRVLMSEFRVVIGRLEAIERDILDDAQERARVSESRFVPILIGLVMAMLVALALGMWQIVRTAQAETYARSMRDIEEARDRADLLSRELNHRVKNLFAVIQAIVRMSLRGEPDPQVASAKIAERINALSIAHSVTQGELETPVASLEDLLRTAVAPYLTDTTALTLEGPDVDVLAKQVTPLGLILHELVTNCVKYGAWSDLGGALDIRWEETADGRIRLVWKESVSEPPRPSGESGFGTRMIGASARQLGGEIDRRFTDTGMELTLTFERS